MTDLKRPPSSGLQHPLLNLFSPLFYIPATVVKGLGAFAYASFVFLTMGRTIRGKSDAKAHTTASSDKQTPTVYTEASCPICQEPIGVRNAEGVTERWSTLPCGHRFGSYCIKYYLGIAADEQPPCPICRTPAYHDECGHPVLPTVLKSNHTHMGLVKTKSRDLSRWRKPFVSLWRAMPFRKETRPAEISPVRERILRNRRRRENPQNWEGPYVDVRERDVEWEKWWKNQPPREA
ncbi:Checkpoint protein hus1 [Collariella sp. IMI 366227]|nr:Checkpoint protein hus1 [Collariella sp. IMI 366227]